MSALERRRKRGRLKGADVEVDGDFCFERQKTGTTPIDLRRLADYQMMRVNEMPEIEVDIVASSAARGGIGEPSTALAAGSLVLSRTIEPHKECHCGSRRAYGECHRAPDLVAVRQTGTRPTA